MKTKLIALGPKGSYGHEAAQIGEKWLGNVYISFVSTNVSILSAAQSEITYAIVPIENSSYGDVVDVLGHLARQSVDYPLRIIGQVELPIRHCLMARKGTTIEELELIMSHPQAIGQCGESIKRWGVKTESVPTSTADAAKFVSGHSERKLGAIASELAAKEYGLNVIERNVQTLDDNTTRFLIFGPESKSSPTGKDKTVIIFKVPNIPGALFEAQRSFAARNINMTAIHSIPLGGWKYSFYVEIEGHVLDTQVSEALIELKEKTSELWILGSFPKDLIV